MNTETYLLILAGALVILAIYLLIRYLENEKFNKYFALTAEEAYDLDNLFPIKISGRIIAKMDYLDIPYEELKLEIKTPTILGQIIGTEYQLSFIRLKDRKKALKLVKSHYLKAVKPYILETNKNKAEYIYLINLSKKQRPKIERVACATCKNTIQCQIAFSKCTYERDQVDNIINKGITIDMRDTPVLKNYGQ